MSADNEPAPVSTLPYPPIHKDKKFVVLSDWLVGSFSPASSMACLLPILDANPAIVSIHS